MINEQIRDKEVRLIGPDGEQLGIMSAREAMAKAQEAELDLVKIAPQAKPPVCKIIDYGKYRYELARKEKEAKKKQKTIDVKEVRLSPNIDTNDLNTKAGAARKFLTKGDRVKVTLRFRGREMAHMSSSKHVLDDFAEMLKDVAGPGSKEFIGKMISHQLEGVINDRESKCLNTKDRGKIPVVDEQPDVSSSQVIHPIIAAGDAIGSVILMGKGDKAIMGTSEKLLVQTAAGFLGRQMEQ